MAVHVVTPTANTSPDPVQGGSAVTGNTNTGHGATLSSLGFEGDNNGSGSATKSCIWSSFQSVSDIVTSITLKLSYTYSISAQVDESPGAGTANGSARVQYSIDGGSNWTSLISPSVSQDADGTNSDSNSGNISQSIAASTPISNIQVRSRVVGGASYTGGSTGAQFAVGSGTLTVSGIQLEVVAGASANPIVLM